MTLKAEWLREEPEKTRLAEARGIEAHMIDGRWEGEGEMQGTGGGG